MKRTLLVLLGLLGAYRVVSAQPEARFLSHRVKTGAPITLRLSLSHDGSSQWVFPDSTSSFGAFELIKKCPFPTVQTPQGYMDSAHYILRTFEIDTTLTLALAVVRVPGDSVFCRSDSIIVVPTEKEAPAKSGLYENTFFRDLVALINWILLNIVLVSAIVVAAAVFLVFGKKIRTHFLLRRLYREKIRFMVEIDALISDPSSKENARQAIILWKTFGGRITKLPLESYTSNETARVLSDAQWIGSYDGLVSALSAMDMGVYAGIFGDSYKQDLRRLKEIAIEIYEKKVYLLKNESKPPRISKPAMV